MSAQIRKAPPAHRNKNCDETVKKRGEMATGAFFEPKKRRWISLSRNAKIKDDEIVANPGPRCSCRLSPLGAGAFHGKASSAGRPPPPSAGTKIGSPTGNCFVQAFSLCSSPSDFEPDHCRSPAKGSQRIFTSLPRARNSGWPVTRSARRSLASAAAKASAKLSLKRALKSAATSAPSREVG